MKNSPFFFSCILLVFALALGACTPIARPTQTASPSPTLPSAVAPTAVYKLFDVIEAEAYTSYSGKAFRIPNMDSSRLKNLYMVSNGDSFIYNRVDLGQEGDTYLMIRLATALEGGTLELRLENPQGPVIGKLEIPNTHAFSTREGVGWSSGWRTVTLPVTGASGVQTICLVFLHPAGQRVADFDWFRLMKPTQPVTYYVSPTGSDKNDGLSPESPLATVSTVTERILPGDTILLRGGTYHQKLFLPSTASGTAKQRVTLMAYPGETPILDGTGVEISHDKEALVQGRADYFTYSGLEIANAPGRGWGSDGDFVRLEKSKIHHTADAGIFFWDSEGVEIVENEVWEAGRMNLPHGKLASGWPGALVGLQSHQALVLGNLVRDNHGEGIIVLKDSYDFIVRENVVRDNWSVGIYLDNAHRTLVENNLVQETDSVYIERNIPTFREIADGISVTDEDYSGWHKSYQCGNPAFTPGGNNTIRNNLAVGTRTGFSFNWQYMECSGVKNTQVENNTFVNTWTEAVYLYPGAHEGNSFYNNIQFRNSQMETVFNNQKLSINSRQPSAAESQGRSIVGRIEAESFSSMVGIVSEPCGDEGGGQNIGWTDPGDYLVFDNVDFGKGASHVAARLAGVYPDGLLEFRLDAPDGLLIATVSIPVTKGWQKYETVNAPVSGAEGIHDLYIVFKGGRRGVATFNWFEFLP